MFSLNGTYYHGFDTFMDENGMDKFVAMIACMLFMIKHDEVHPDQAYGTKYDISDFEIGEYDDLKLIKAGIRIIKEYLSKHPELLKTND